MPVLEWAHEQGYAFDVPYVRRAIMSSSPNALPVLPFLHGIDAPWLGEGESVRLALMSGDADKLKWLRSVGMAWGRNPLAACQNARMRDSPAYKWAVENGAPPLEVGDANALPSPMADEVDYGGHPAGPLLVCSRMQHISESIPIPLRVVEL